MRLEGGGWGWGLGRASCDAAASKSKHSQQGRKIWYQKMGGSTSRMMRVAAMHAEKFAIA